MCDTHSNLRQATYIHTYVYQIIYAHLRNLSLAEVIFTVTIKKLILTRAFLAYHNQFYC